MISEWNLPHAVVANDDQLWGGAARGCVCGVEGRGGVGQGRVGGEEHVDNITSENILPFKSVKWHS